MKTYKYWFSSRKMTVKIVTDSKGTILDAAPIVKRFIGQHRLSLMKWMGYQGGFKQHKFKD